jgi:hypothetical protein
VGAENMRNLPNKLITAINENIEEDKTLEIGIALFLDIKNDPTYIHSGVGNISFNGQTWVGVGDLASVSGVTEDIQMSDGRMVIKLLDLPNGEIPNIINTFCTGDQSGRRFEFYMVLYADGIISSNVQFQAGYIDQPELDDQDEKSVFTLMLSNETTKLNKTVKKLMSDQIQQEFYAADKGLEFAADANLNDVLWGAEKKVIQKANSPAWDRDDYNGGFWKFRDRF